jgi:hypothetical protein
MAAEVNGASGTLEIGAVRVLFEVHTLYPSKWNQRVQIHYVYDVTADGQRFLVNIPVEQKASAPITLVLNWTADLKR